MRIDLIPTSFVPEETSQDLRDLTRSRKSLVKSCNKEKNKIHKILQTAGIKMTTYIEDIFGASGRNLLEMLINGGILTEETIAANVYTSLKKKIPQLVDALNGFVRSHHRFMLEQEYDMILAYEKTIKNMEERIDQVLENYQEEVAVLDELPGIDRKTAAVIIAEIGTNMT